MSMEEEFQAGREATRMGHCACWAVTMLGWMLETRSPQPQFPHFWQLNWADRPSVLAVWLEGGSGRAVVLSFYENKVLRVPVWK